MHACRKLAIYEWAWKFPGTNLRTRPWCMNEKLSLQDDIIKKKLKDVRVNTNGYTSNLVGSL